MVVSLDFEPYNREFRMFDRDHVLQIYTQQSNGKILSEVQQALVNGVLCLARHNQVRLLEKAADQREIRQDIAYYHLAKSEIQSTGTTTIESLCMFSSLS